MGLPTAGMDRRGGNMGPLHCDMGRIRTVKPELFKHGDLYDAEKETGLPIRVAFIALFTVCDREGRFKWRPRELKLECLPYDDVDFSRVLHALATRGFLVKYALQTGEEYGCIPSFVVHQVINNREAVSTLPSPTDTGVIDASPTREARVTHALTTPAKGKGREGKGTGKEVEGKADDERKMLFANCPINDLEAMKAAFPELVAEGVDMEHYRDAIRNWSDTKDEKRSARGWSATVRQWTKTDRDKGELKKINAAFPVKGPLTAATAKVWADRIRADKGLAPGSALGFEEMPLQLREFYMR